LTEVAVSELHLGELLAEGGEGRVFEVRAGARPTGYRCVYKELRHPRPLAELSSLVAFPSSLAVRDQGLAARVRSSSAWPTSVVVGADPLLGVGTVLPRAPAEFWVRHRDGARRLATLSYLANDPDRIAVAYGVMVPAPGAPERVAVVYALARLLEAWQGRSPEAHVAREDQVAAEAQVAPEHHMPEDHMPEDHMPKDHMPEHHLTVDEADVAPEAHAAFGASIVHGDLSAKNVLWSLDPAPAVYVLDCDGASICSSPGPPAPELDDRGANGIEHYPSSGVLAPPPRPLRRLRATTPNWDDPALAPGGNPTEATDRYLLAITFLRVVGAAHFPLQGRQRSARTVNVDLELPRSWRKFPDMPGLWELCERSLSLVNAADRPTPGEWADQLEELLGVLSSEQLAAAVRGAQGDLHGARREPMATQQQSAKPTDVARVTVPDVVVRPVLRHRAPATWKLISAGAPLSLAGDASPALGTGPAGGTGRPLSAPLTPSQLVRRVMSTWGGAHRAAARWARSPGRRAYGVRRLVGVLVLDLAAACVGVFVVAMIISPWIGL
jgi:hypothetical protein